MESPGSISLRVEKKVAATYKYFEKSPCIVFSRERQRKRKNMFKNFLNIVTRIDIMTFL